MPQGGLDVRVVESPRSAAPVPFVGTVDLWRSAELGRVAASVRFSTPPALTIVKGDPQVQFGVAGKVIAYPVFAETYVSRLLNRDEFRRLCDTYQTPSRILAHL